MWYIILKLIVRGVKKSIGHGPATPPFRKYRSLKVTDRQLSRTSQQNPDSVTRRGVKRRERPFIPACKRAWFCCKKCRRAALACPRSGTAPARRSDRRHPTQWPVLPTEFAATVLESPGEEVGVREGGEREPTAPLDISNDNEVSTRVCGWYTNICIFLESTHWEEHNDSNIDHVRGCFAAWPKMTCISETVRLQGYVPLTFLLTTS